MGAWTYHQTLTDQPSTWHENSVSTQEWLLYYCLTKCSLEAMFFGAQWVDERKKKGDSKKLTLVQSYTVYSRKRWPWLWTCVSQLSVALTAPLEVTQRCPQPPIKSARPSLHQTANHFHKLQQHLQDLTSAKPSAKLNFIWDPLSPFQTYWF